MEDVLATLERQRPHPLFSHIEQIDSPAPWTLDIRLRQPDEDYPGCWAASVR